MFPDSFRRGAALMLALLVAAIPASAQQRQLTLDDLYDPERKVDFTGRPPQNLVWLDDSHYVWPRSAPGDQETEWLKVEAVSGRSEPFFDAARMESALTALPGISRDEARRLARQNSYTMSRAHDALLLTIADDLYYYDLRTAAAKRLTRAPGTEEEASFSPDGRLVAFVRDHNLYAVDVANGLETPLTTDGSDEILNGRLDWVYQEEIYGRGRFRAYWWSADSSRLAYLQLNEHGVPQFTVLDHVPYHLDVETWHYPKAGDPNPDVKLGVVGAAGGRTTWMDLDEYAPVQILIVNVGWRPDSGELVFQVQDREQTWLDLRLGDPSSGGSRRVLRETTTAWVNANDNPEWLDDGSFLWLSERTGWNHLYHYKADGTLVRPVTTGEWEIRRLAGVHQASGWIYVEATERSHIGVDVYRVRIDGTGFSRLSPAAGTHRANFSPAFRQYIDTWSDLTTPPQVRLHRADGTEVRVIDENRVAALADYRLSTPELRQVTTRDGFVMEAMMIKPPDFDPSRRYPVYQHTYGGPHAPQVRNAWGGTTYLYHQLLAQHGIIVWICDNRTASGKGAVSTWPVYQRFGELELRDIEDGVDWLTRQPYVDDSRMAINGWSYGGFMVSYALTRSRRFAAGIAGGAVTDWRDYDTIYTERYMRMPQNNPEGYRASSPRFAAKDLHGALLLIHGTMDDNVHMQNALQFAYELQQAGKPFELMLYPTSRHAIGDPRLLKHVRATMLSFLLRHLRPGEAAATAGGKF